MDYSKYNRANVAENVEKLLREAKDHNAKYKYWKKKYVIRDVCDELSIFDWWNDEIGVSQLEIMRSFLNTAGKLGYNGYVCFKVGASGCSNGMWAHKTESETGYSPDGEFIYRSFTPDYVCWDAQLADGTLVSEAKRDSRDLKLKDVKEAIGA